MDKAYARASSIFAIAAIAVLLGSTASTAAFAATVYKAPNDTDPPKIKWLDQQITEGTYRFQIALKDPSTITTKQISYTRYDQLFQEYDTLTAQLTPSSITDIYYADIDAKAPETTITLNVADAWGNADSETHYYPISPSGVSLLVTLAASTVQVGQPVSVQLKNNQTYDIPVQVALTINGLSSLSSYSTLTSNTISGLSTQTLTFPANIAPQDTNRQLNATVTVKAFGVTKAYPFNVSFLGQRTTQDFNAVKPRYSVVPVSGSFTVDASVARAVFILEHGSSLVTPSGNNLPDDVSNLPSGQWNNFIKLDNSNTPIEMRVFRFDQGKTIVIIDVPQIGTYTTSLNAVALVRHYG